jgi:uncharacterized integral membrane protein
MKLIYSKNKKAQHMKLIVSIIIILIVLILVLIMTNGFHDLSLGFIHNGEEIVNNGLLG